MVNAKKTVVRLYILYSIIYRLVAVCWLCVYMVLSSIGIHSTLVGYTGWESLQVTYYQIQILSCLVQALGTILDPVDKMSIKCSWNDHMSSLIDKSWRELMQERGCHHFVWLFDFFSDFTKWCQSLLDVLEVDFYATIHHLNDSDMRESGMPNLVSNFHSISWLI